MEEKITMTHGSGGSATADLIREIFAKEFDNETLRQMEDAAVVPGKDRLALTTDSFVATPLFFRGGDLGKLSVCGTVNDLLCRGAHPAYLTAGFILEEGLPVESLRKLAHSLAVTAEEAGVTVVAGDTKVIEGSGGIYINTAGVGLVEENTDISVHSICPGDAILLSGSIGEHHAALLSARLSLENEIESDCAPLREMAEALLDRHIAVHAMRDVTRGGLATVVSEMAETSGKNLLLYEDRIPVNASVRSFAGILGLDPLYMGNEGKMLFFVPQEMAEDALMLIRSSRYGEKAEKIGEVTEDGSACALLRTAIGGERILRPLAGEGLPRIC